MHKLNNRNRIGFVILHYNVDRVTNLCISNLLKLYNSEFFEIVVVDNASPNGSGEKLKEKYKKNEKIHVILSKKNLGFAKGNNLGFEFLKENYKLDFMIVMNNDIMIENINFINDVSRFFSKTGFDILGPDIFIPDDGVHQNPIRKHSFTYRELMKMHFKLKIINIFFPWFFLKHKIGNILKQFIKIKKGYNQADLSNTLTMSEKNNFVLHGACYVFSSNFIKKRDYAFWPGTFMYFEEDILQYECVENNLKVVFCPFLQVLHLEDASTNSVLKSEYKKELFKYRQLYNSEDKFLKNYKVNFEVKQK